MVRPLCPSVKRQFINMQHHKKAKVLEFATTSATTASSSRRQQQWRPMLSCPFSRCSCLIWLIGFYPFSSRGHPSPSSCMHAYTEAVLFISSYSALLPGQRLFQILAIWRTDKQRLNWPSGGPSLFHYDPSGRPIRSFLFFTLNFSCCCSSTFVCAAEFSFLRLWLLQLD